MEKLNMQTTNIVDENIKRIGGVVSRLPIPIGSWHQQTRLFALSYFTSF